MKMNVIDHAEMKAVSSKNGSRMRPKWQVALLLIISVAFGAGGCADYYGGYYGAGYGPGPYYRGYGPYYGGYPGSVTVAVGDRPYYTHGPGYWAGRTYYVWRPGHWRRGVWIRGHYVVR